MSVAGRVVALRDHGKTCFAHLMDDTGRIQLYARAEQLGDDFALFTELDLGDFVGVDGELFRTRTGELTRRRVKAFTFLAKALRPLPEKWHGLQGRRDALPPALPRPDRQPRGARASSCCARGIVQAHARVPRRARLPRGRDADDAADPRRRGGAAVRHAPQRARHGPLPAHRARALPQAAGGRRLRARLRDRPQLPQRGHLDAAQSRVHDARVLPGLRRLRRT